MSEQRLVKILTDKLIAGFIFIRSAFAILSFFFLSLFAIVYTITPYILLIAKDSMSSGYFIFCHDLFSFFNVLVADSHDVNVGKTPV